MASLELIIQASKARSGAMEFTNASMQVEGSANKAATSVGNLNSALGSTGSVAGSVARVVAGLFAGFGAFQAVRESTRTFAEFEQTLATLKGVTTATSDEMAALKATALDMGASSRSSANDAAEGLLILAKAGFSTKSATEALPGVLALATAHALDLGTAADYTANILNQFQLNTVDTNRVVDVLSTTANKSQADVRDLAEAMKYAGPAAGSLGVSVEEAAAAAGVLSDRGIKASLAGTNLRGIMIDLINPTEKARKALEVLGLSVADVDLRTVGFTEAMKRLSQAGAGAGDLAKIFGLMQVSGATAIVQNIKRLEELTEANRTAAGSTKELVTIMSDTLMGRFDQLINVLGVVVNSIGDSGFGLAVKNTLVIIADGIRVLSGFEDKIVGTKENADAAARVIKTLGIYLGLLVGINIVAWLAGVAKGLLAATFTTAGWNAQLAITTGLLTGLLAMDLGAYLYEEFKGVRQFGDDLAAAIQTAGSEIQYYWDVMIVYLKKGWAAFIDSIKNESKMFQNVLAGASNVLAPGAGSVMLASIAGGVSVSSYDAEGELAQAQAARNQRQLDISAGYSAIQDQYKQEFKGGDRLTGDSYLKHLGDGLDSVTKALEDQIKAWTGLSTGIETSSAAIQGALTDTGRAQEEYQERQRDLTILNEEAHALAVQMVDDINAEAEALRLSQRERNVLIKVTQFQTVAEQAYGKETERTIRAVEDYTDAINKLEDTKADRRTGEILRQIKAEREGLMLNSKERSIAVEVARFHAQAEEMYGKNTKKSAEATAAFAEELSKLRDQEELRALADDIGNEFGRAFTDIVFGAKSAQEAIEGLTKAVIQLVFQELVAKQLSSWISGGIMGTSGSKSANGNVFSGGSVQAFASGGIVGGPTLFPMSSGRTGLMGEAGPEAIMPLGRTASGKLGVEVTGHATKVINTYVTVESPNPNEFRGSERQIAAKMRGAISRL